MVLISLCLELPQMVIHMFISQYTDFFHGHFSKKIMRKAVIGKISVSGYKKELAWYGPTLFI
jgi:hypothetical protein